MMWNIVMLFLIVYLVLLGTLGIGGMILDLMKKDD